MCQGTQKLTAHIRNLRILPKSTPYLFPAAWRTRVRRLNLFGIGLENTIHGVYTGASLCVRQNDNFVTESRGDFFQCLSSCFTRDVFDLVPTSF